MVVPSDPEPLTEKELRGFREDAAWYHDPAHPNRAAIEHGHKGLCRMIATIDTERAAHEVCDEIANVDHRR